MRILVPVCVGLAVMSCATSAVLWSQRHSDRQLIDQLRTQLSDATTALAKRTVPVAATGSPVVPLRITPTQTAEAAPIAPPAKITREEAIAVLNADALKRQKALAADAEYRSASLAQAREEMRNHYAGLAAELGLSEQQMNAVLDVLAESQSRAMTFMAGMPDGGQPDAATRMEIQRLMDEEQQKQKVRLTAMLGAQGYSQFEEYDRMQPSRTRVSNLTTLLARSGRPLTNAQTKSLTTAMYTEQRRMEAEAKSFRDTGQTDQRSQADIQGESNRRLLEQVPTFLDAQQVQIVRGRFEQRATIDRASERLQQREREVVQEKPN